jgi:hypothetical protein
MPELPERTSSMQANMGTSRWAPTTNAQSTRLGQGHVTSQPPLPALSSMRSASSVTSQPTTTPAAAQSTETLPSRSSSIIGGMQDPSRFYPKDRQLINTFTGEVVTPMIFPPKDAEKEEAWRKHNQDFMSQAKKVLGISKIKEHENHQSNSQLQARTMATATVNTNNARRQEQASTNFRIPPPGVRALQIRQPEQEPMSSNDRQDVANILTKMRSNPNSPSRTNGAQNSRPMQRIYSHNGAVNEQPIGPAAGVSPASPASPSDLPDALHGKAILNKDGLSKATSLIKAQQISAAMYQVTARDISEKYKASCKVLNETARDMKHLHSVFLSAAKEADAALQKINDLGRSLTAATDAFMAAALPADLDERARDVLENHLRPLDRVQIITQLQASFAAQSASRTERGDTSAQEVKLLNNGVLVSLAEETTVTTSTAVQGVNGMTSIAQEHYQSSNAAQPAVLVDLSDTSLQSVESSTVATAQPDCK